MSSPETEEILKTIAKVELSLHTRIGQLETLLIRKMDAFNLELASLRTLVKTLTNEKAVQHEGYRHIGVELDRAIRKINDRIDDMHESQKVLDGSIEVLEARVRRLRESVIPDAPATV